MKLMSHREIIVFESPDPKRIYAYSPGITRLPSGRLIATMDIGGPGACDLHGVKWLQPEPDWACLGLIYTSDDGGKTWILRGDFPFVHARPFSAGNRIYILGHANDLMIIQSRDDGETWSDPVKLTKGQFWHQAPCNVHYANGCVYLVMERRLNFKITTWPVCELAPVLMRANEFSDLTRIENWTFASELSFHDLIPCVESEPSIEYFGIPFFNAPYPHGSDPAPDRNCAPPGWLETNVVQFFDPEHIWHDPSGKTFHLWMRAHTGSTGYACIAKVVEQGEQPGTGEMYTQLVTVPSGKKVLYIPCPGGQMKFHVLYDAISRLFWLLSTQAVDSMIHPEKMSPERFSIPNNERRRLQLHFSRNMVDWCFAGMVAIGPADNASRHYASMVIDGEDLAILCRSGDEQAQSSHDGNLITFHRVKNFRSLIY
jgi:hypothetical protein